MGCGAPLQSEHKDAPGYVPSSAAALDEPLCRRCFRIRNYGEFSRVEVSSDEYAAEVARIVNNPGLVLYVMDVWDMSGSLVPGLAQYVGGSKVVVVVNKTDVLPPEVAPESLRSWVISVVKATGITPFDVVFVSAKRSLGIEELASKVESYGENIVYAVGMANVGKSSVLNELTSRFGQGTVFTASRVPGTTLRAVGTRVKTPFGKTLLVVDTPGLIHGNRVTDSLCADCLKTVVPDERIKARVYQLDPGQSLWLGAFARLDFEAGNHQSVVCYVSSRLVVHRTKLERAEVIYNERADEILQVPCRKCRTKLKDFVDVPVTSQRRTANRLGAREFVVQAGGTDLVLAGLGWITLAGTFFRGTLWIPDNIHVSTRRKLIGGVSARGRRDMRRG